MRELGEKQSLCQLPRSISWLDSQLVYLPSLVQKVWYLIPNAPINHPIVRIFIVQKMRFLSPDDALLG